MFKVLRDNYEPGAALKIFFSQFTAKGEVTAYIQDMMPEVRANLCFSVGYAYRIPLQLTTLPP